MNEFDKANQDAALYGSGFMINGKHVPIEDVIIMTKPEMPDCVQCVNSGYRVDADFKIRVSASDLICPKCTNGSEFKQSPPIRLYEIDEVKE